MGINSLPLKTIPSHTTTPPSSKTSLTLAPSSPSTLTTINGKQSFNEMPHSSKTEHPNDTWHELLSSSSSLNYNNFVRYPRRSKSPAQRSKSPTQTTVSSFSLWSVKTHSTIGSSMSDETVYSRSSKVSGFLNENENLNNVNKKIEK
jgi:hypothetical protein